MKVNLALLPESVGGKMSFNLLDNNGKKSRSHFLELMRKRHAGTRSSSLFYIA